MQNLEWATPYVDPRGSGFGERGKRKVPIVLYKLQLPLRFPRIPQSPSPCFCLSLSLPGNLSKCSYCFFSAGRNLSIWLGRYLGKVGITSACCPPARSMFCPFGRRSRASSIRCVTLRVGVGCGGRQADIQGRALHAHLDPQVSSVPETPLV